MNKIILMGRLTANPEITYSQGEKNKTKGKKEKKEEEPKAVARYQLAVNRRYNREEVSADFFRCVAFGKSAEFAEKYLCKGMKIIVTGRLHSGSYTNPQGQKVYTTDVIVEDQEFAENKDVNEAKLEEERNVQPGEFMNLEITEDLPFN